MKYYEVVRTDLDSCYGAYKGETVIKRYLDRTKAEEFAADWEARWRRNKENKLWNEKPCWIDTDEKLKIREVNFEFDD